MFGHGCGHYQTKTRSVLAIIMLFLRNQPLIGGIDINQHADTQMHKKNYLRFILFNYP